MTISCVVQARMGSTRLPGKVMAELCGDPILKFMLHRLSDLSVDHLIVATTDLAADDPIAELAAAERFDVVRGSETDVLRRFVGALDAYPVDVAVRLTADCPLIDPDIVEAALSLREHTGADYASNTLIRTFPDGLDVEVVTAKALREAAVQAFDPVEREHVTPFIYRRPEQYRLVALRHEVPLGDERWTLDTAEDLDFLREIVKRMSPRKTFGWLEVLEVAGRRSVPPRGSLRLRPAYPYDSSLLLAWRNDPTAVRFSRSGAPVDPSEHERWIKGSLNSPGIRIWIGEINGEPVGQVRIDVSDGIGTVSVSIAAEQRDRGYGTGILRALKRVLTLDYQVTELVGEVHIRNIASRRAFEKAGFEVAGRKDDFLQMRFVR